jgi:hypothetical protein
MQKINFLFFLLFAAFAMYSGCDDTGVQIDEREIPASDVSYQQHIQPVFEVKCATSGCHEDATRAGGLSLTSWFNTTAPGVVNPFQPQNSRLVWAIEGQAGISPMPPIGFRPLTLNQINGIKKWIEEGAENN